MSTLSEWQSFARSTNLRGWSRLKKDDLVNFLMENLWKEGSGKPKMKTTRKKRNPLMKKNKKINVPFLIPERRKILPRVVPRAIKENINNVVDWADWLESVKDAEIRKRSTPAVEKLKKQIAELWGEKLTVEKGKSAFGKFARQFIIRGDDSLSPQDFFRKARGEIKLLLRQNPQTKVQCILNVEMIQNRISGEDESSNPFFPSRQKENLGNNFDIVEEMIQEMIEAMENYNKRGSNWVFKKVIRLDVNFVRWNPLRGSAWIPLPEELAYKKAVINMKNRDNMCFKWCIARAANMVENHPERIDKLLREQAEKFDWTDCKFPMALDKIKIFEKRNDISVNVYQWKECAYPLRITKEEKPFHVDLVFLTKDFENHFALIKNFSRFASSQVPGKGHTERFFCKRCLNSFPRPESLEKHKEICGDFAAAKVELPGGKCSFKNWERMMHVPVVVFADFESILKLRLEGNKTHEHIPCGFCFHLVSPFLQMEPVLKRAENETNQLPQDFIRELISRVKQAHLSLPKKEMIPLSKEEWKKFRESKVCWLCRGKFGEKTLSKVRDHCHFTGKFRGAAHQSCNLKFQRPKFTPVFFHNLQNYDAHLFVRALGLMDEVLSIKCIPNNDEKYISFSVKFELKRIKKWDWKTEEWKEVVVKHEIRFLDSFKFTLSGLEGLVKNLSREDLKETARFFGEKIDLVSRKGVYPYEFMNDFEKFKKQSLPKKTSFFSRLTQKKVSDEDFEHAQRVWKEFELKNMGDFHDLYLKTDVLLLADVMENFRKLCEKHYGLDPAHFFTVPGMAWDAMLKMTEVDLELLEDVDQLLMIEKGIRGGISNAFKRYAKANNKFMQSFDPELKSSFIVYLDANNLYGWAMSKPLPVGGFEWMSEAELKNWERFVEEEGIGCILEVDLEYPAELHDFHNDFPLAPEKLTLGKVVKLTQNLRDKEAMVLHGKNLQLYLSLGMKLKSIRRGLKFKEKNFMKCYIDKNTSLRSQAKNDFEKELFKLMNNSVFGKTMENVRNRVKIELVKDAERAAKLVNKPNFEELKIFDEFLIAVKMRKTKVWMNKPVYVGMSILDLSKTLMFEFQFRYVKKKWENCEVLYSDTDSLVLWIETEDFFADISGDVAEWFDTNDFPKDHPAVVGGLPIVKANKKKIGLMKDECGGKIVTEWVALRPKLYSFLMEDGEKQKAKGLKKSMKNKSLRHENFLKCLRTGESQKRKQCLFRSRDHHIFTENMVKIALSANDDKRIVLENGIDTLGIGHWRLS